MTSHLILSLTICAKSATGRRRVRVGVEIGKDMVSANSAGWGGDGGGEQCEVGLGRRVARGSVRLVGEECGVGWRWSANSAGWGGDGRRTVRVGVEMVAANSARLVWNEGWPVGRCGWSAKSAGWGGDGGGEQCEVGLGRRVVRGSVRLVGEECGVGWRWCRRTVRVGVEMVAANSARLVWDATEARPIPDVLIVLLNNIPIRVTPSGERVRRRPPGMRMLDGCPDTSDAIWWKKLYLNYIGTLSNTHYPLPTTHYPLWFIVGVVSFFNFY